jgi:hypothetical protein
MPNIGYDFALELLPGEQYNTYSTERWPVGTLGIQQDGRSYRFAYNSSSAALVAGNVIAAPAPVTNHQGLTAVVTPLGALSISLALGATAVLKDQYKGGLITVSVTPGGGDNYAVPSNAVDAGSDTLIQPLAPGDSVRTALTTASKLNLVANSYRNVIQSPATTLTSPPVGIAQLAVPVSTFCWIQVAGLASVLTAGTVVIGEQVIAATGTAGAVGPSANSEIRSIIGRVAYVAATTAWSVIDLNVQ